METREPSEEVLHDFPSFIEDLKTTLESSYGRGEGTKVVSVWNENQLGWDPKQGFLSFYLASREARRHSIAVTSRKEATVMAVPWDAGLLSLPHPPGRAVGTAQDETVVGPPEVAQGHTVGENPQSIMSPPPERVAGSDLWRGLRRLLIGAFTGTIFLIVGVLLAAIEAVTWPVSAAFVIMGVGLLATFLAFAGDIRRTAQSRYFMIVQPLEDSASD